MDSNKDIIHSLEALLESLIRMVAKSNEHVDSLNNRVEQMEFIIMELKKKECCLANFQDTPPGVKSGKLVSGSRFMVSV